jgi:hypothetical protein
MNTKRWMIVILVLVAALSLGLSVVGAQQGNSGANGNGYRGGQNAGAVRGTGGFMLNLPAASVSELPQDVVDLMVSGWLDEQHAYAVYGAVIDQFGAVRPFTNIQRSEAQHIAAWETLFARYGIAVPAVPTFDLPVFTSVSEACSIGATAEVANSGLYDTMLTVFQPYPDVQYVAQSLRDASEFSHLPAFENCAAR